MVDVATGEASDKKPTPEEQGKNPAAVSLGRRGGLKGGKARADSMSPKRRSEIAQKATQEGLDLGQIGKDIFTSRA
jgi:hypothetical protein